MNDQATLQKALYTIKKLRHLLQEQRHTLEPIAIVGLSCRFPQAVGKDAYWQMLREGKNVITHIPDRRWELLKGSDEEALRDDAHPYWGGFLSAIDEFDAYYFGISPREAVRMDPQHRLLLEVAHEAIEDAGLPLEAIAGTKTGVFASLYVSQLAHLQKMDNEMDALYLPTGNAMSIAANRLSYLFDLRGPSVVIDSACSSSMTSLYLAYLNIQSKTCDMALVCGAKLNLLPYINFVLTKAKMLSPDGQCKTFDADANGYVQGEGVGVIVLKPLTKALQDKDRIYAVITGAAINQDGRTNGLTAPNGLQQEVLLRAAYESAGINPHDISYVECHGTGTFLGDPIELQSLGEVIGKTRESQKPCLIGSVKTNIGHLEPAAGIASIIKVALALKHSQIPPHLNFEKPNPHIQFDRYNFKVPTTLQEWPRYSDVRIAGLSGFGFGGANAHLVMRDLSDTEHQRITETKSSARSADIFTLSAKNELALKELVKRWCDFLTENSSIPFEQLCYNIHVRRNHFNHRLAIIASTHTELLQRLQDFYKRGQPDNDNVFLSGEKTKNNSNKAITNIASLDLKELANLYVNQAAIAWKEYEKDNSFPNNDMPLYPWQHKSYWPPLGHKTTTTSNDNDHPLKGRFLQSPLAALQFEFTASSNLLPDLKDTYNILHAGYYLEILAFSVKQLTGQDHFCIEDHLFIAPLIVANNNVITIYLTLEKDADGNYDFTFYSNVHGQKQWLKNASGKLLLTPVELKTIPTIADIKAQCPINEAGEQLYQRVIAMGMPAGESIRWTHQYWLGDNDILCEFIQPTNQSQNDQFTLKIHPGVFDAAIQPLFRLLPEEYTHKPYIASGAKRLHFFGCQGKQFYLWGRLKDTGQNGETILGDCWLLNEDNQIIAYLEDIHLAQLENRLQIEDLLAAKTKSLRDLASMPIPERKDYIVTFLINQVAIIFSIPKEDIVPSNSLRELGIDSLMALVLLRAIEVGLEAHFSMQELLEGPTINELAEHLANHIRYDDAALNAQADESITTRWISYRKPQPNAKLKLFCFPYGGGGASIYRDWQNHLTNDIEVCPIQLPGREERMDEPAIADINEVVAMLITQLQPELTKPFAFFGHSFGSLLSFELTSQLRKKNMSMPEHLFVSAFPDPRVPTSSLDKLLMQLQSIKIELNDINHPSAIERLTSEQLIGLSNVFTENGIVGYGDYLLEKDILKVLLPIFIGDMGIVKSYHYSAQSPLDIPITVFAGKKDTWVSYDDHLKWHEHTSQTCNFVTFDSGHMFIKEPDNRDAILQTISETLLFIAEEQYVD